MSESVFMLQPRCWSGLTEVPTCGSQFGRHFVSTPVYLTAVQPLKTGKGLLRLEFLQPLVPGGGEARMIVGKVVQKAKEHITVLFDDKELGSRTAIFSPPTFDWLETFCPELMARRPRKGPAFYVDGVAIGDPSAQDHLERVLGRTEEEILNGTQSSSFGVKLYKLPKQRSTFLLDIELDPFDSCLVARGFTPTAMEEKWFIYLEGDRLLFRRSWTGFLIYDVEAVWSAGPLYLGKVRVNRNPKQYTETDDEYDRRLLLYLIQQVLCGVPAEFPFNGDEETASLEAWSIAGSASLTK
jgi:hypothetical protein